MRRSPITKPFYPRCWKSTKGGRGLILYLVPSKLMMNFSSFSRRLLKEVAWAGFGKIAAALGMLVGIRLLTEKVPKEVYGTVSLLIGLITLGNNLFAAPLLQAAQRFHSGLSNCCYQRRSNPGTPWAYTAGIYCPCKQRNSPENKTAGLFGRKACSSKAGDFDWLCAAAVCKKSHLSKNDGFSDQTHRQIG